MNLRIYQPASVEPGEFVTYWSKLYPKQDDAEHYTPNIGSRAPDALKKLFLWKFGKRFAAKTRKDVETIIISRLAELNALPDDLSAADFLRRFSKDGAIFRIFLLHCWSPIELWSHKKKIAAYLQDYLAFHSFFAAFDQRSVDRALWAFGKFIKTSRLPGGCRHRH
jgi:hypothetical protein